MTSSKASSSADTGPSAAPPPEETAPARQFGPPPPVGFDRDAARRAANQGIWSGSQTAAPGQRRRYPYSIMD
jgi:hypothetical protein